MEHLLCALHSSKHFTLIISNLILILLGEVLQPSLARWETLDPGPLVTYPRPQDQQEQNQDSNPNLASVSQGFAILPVITTTWGAGDEACGPPPPISGSGI